MRSALRRRLGAAAIAAPIVRGARAALDVADAALLRRAPPCWKRRCAGCPACALYVVSAAQARSAGACIAARFVTLPNILLAGRVDPGVDPRRRDAGRLAAAARRAAAQRPSAQLARCGSCANGSDRPTRWIAARPTRSSLGGLTCCASITPPICTTVAGSRHRLRALRARAAGLLFDCGDSLRGSQTVYLSARADRRRDRSRPATTRRDGQPRVPLSLRRRSRRARGACTIRSSARI